MRILRFLAHSLFLITTPIIAYPQMPPQLEIQRIHYEEEPIYDGSLSYDDAIHLLEQIESDELVEQCTPRQLEQLNYLVAFLAKQGALADGSEESNSLESDVEALLYGSSYAQTFSPGVSKYRVIPAISYQQGDILLCKSWAYKIKKFVKKHKVAIIIGVIVVVAATVVIAVTAGSAAATAAAAAAAGSAGEIASNCDQSVKQKKQPTPSPSSPSTSTIAPNVTEAIHEQVFSFKENLVREQLFQPSTHQLPLAEQGRVLGSVFAHDSFQRIDDQFSTHPSPFQNATNFAAPKQIGHSQIDAGFATQYAPWYVPGGTGYRLSPHQALGEQALAHGHYEQAVQNLDRAIALEPTNPLPYLQRGTAHFQLQQYDHSLEDYHQFVTQTEKTVPLSVPEFGVGFAKGLPKGIYDSGSGLFLFLSDLIQHPIHTGEQVWEALTLLSNLARSDQWGALSEALAPEIHQLVQQWDTLPSDKRGELAGYAFGKYGSDILLPGALAKTFAKGLRGAEELGVACRNLQTAEQTLLLESAAGVGNSSTIAEVIRANQTTIALGEEVGFSVHEVAQLKQAAKLEGAIDTALEDLVIQSENRTFTAATNGEKHVKFYQDYLNKPTKEIQKGIQSYEKQIAIHQEKISNPSKGIPNWDKLHPERKEALIKKKWPAEIKCYSEQRDILKSILNQRVRN